MPNLPLRSVMAAAISLLQQALHLMHELIHILIYMILSDVVV
jgi:hypothetical protein